jgi:hypothetical protein
MRNARRFTAGKMRQVTAFSRTPIGRKFRPVPVQESMGIASTFGQAMVGALRVRTVEGLRKRGHKI